MPGIPDPLVPDIYPDFRAPMQGHGKGVTSFSKDAIQAAEKNQKRAEIRLPEVIISAATGILIEETYFIDIRMIKNVTADG